MVLVCILHDFYTASPLEYKQFLQYFPQSNGKFTLVDTVTDHQCHCIFIIIHQFQPLLEVEVGE